MVTYEEYFRVTGRLVVVRVSRGYPISLRRCAFRFVDRRTLRVEFVDFEGDVGEGMIREFPSVDRPFNVGCLRTVTVELGFVVSVRWRGFGIDPRRLIIEMFFYNPEWVEWGVVLRELPAKES
jgi:hypothetical protein